MNPDPSRDLSRMPAPLPEIADRGGPLQPLLSATGLRKEFRLGGGFFGPRAVVHAVDDFSLTVIKGETVGIVGESGCGKSTAARLLAGITPADDGEIIFDGETFWTPRSRISGERRRAIQMVFQDSASSLNPRMTLTETLAFGPRAHGVPTATARAYARDLLAAVGLPPARFAERYPIELSGGQRQRVNIARALAIRPRLLILDEPVSALDKSVEAQVLNLLVSLRDQLGLSYVFISHDLNVVRYISDRVVVMYLGQIVEEASAQDIFAAPRHPYTRALFASKPSIDPRQRVTAPPLVGDPPDPVNPPSGCRFRTRCPIVEAICANARPPLSAMPGAGGTHRAACWAALPGNEHSLSPRQKGALQ
ncbi:ABC transporter ATP-binding protein [Ancylobacter sp. FA202]|uniref:ABC transporter ATP-binding protein n=1 Tax=Ancylobacter sp. FA202 TaxID=1111106 RepID=UPI000377B719|nr:ABC transporter ATP-binding protein [Ancylobacter sp. FA202]